VAGAWERFVALGEDFDESARLRDRDGAYRWFLARAAPVRGDSGGITGFCGSFVDVHAQRESSLRALEELRRAFDVLDQGDPCFVLDSEFRYVFVNRRQEELSRVSRAEALGRTLWEVFPLAAQPGSKYWQEYHRVMRERVFSEFDEYYAPRDMWTHVRVYPTKEGGIAVFFHDVTERKRAEVDRARTEAALRESEQQYRTFFDLATVGMGQVDAKTGRILQINDRFCEITGYSRDELLADCIVDLTHPDDKPEAIEQFGRLLRGEIPEYSAEKRYVRKNGEIIWVHTAARVIRGYETGDPIRTVGITMDITERKRAEEALRKSEAALRDADDHKNAFLAMLSHELRNPLAPIQNSIFILERAAPGSDQAKRAHAVIHRQVQHMARLIDDLLDVTRISRGKIRLQRERVELRDILERTAEDHAEVFQKSGVELEFVPPDHPVFVDGDPMRLAQVLGNLLQNSAKFTPRGGRTTLSLTQADDGHALVRVEDNGVGIAPETLEDLFDPFVQADRTLDRSSGGLGLGLALVKGLIKMHGGTVRAESAGLGKGATFLLELPAERPPAQRPPPTSAARRDSARRVLVIEDNVDAADSLKEALEIFGHVVEVAYAGPEGIEKARAFGPDVVLCDIGLPGMDGYGVARMLRADEKLHSVFSVALSGYARQEDIEKSHEAGFDRHMAKPPDLPALEKMLADAPAAR
jgi:PAS domain S-box-containing protein